MSESGEVKEASKPGVAKATSSIFPSVEVIQGEPVSNEVPVEGLAPSFSDRPEVAKQGTDPVQAQAGAKAPPFMLELFVELRECVHNSAHLVAVRLAWTTT